MATTTHRSEANKIDGIGRVELKAVNRQTRIPPLTKQMNDQQRAWYDEMLFMAREISESFAAYLDGPNLHTDDELARRSGFPGRIAPGVQTYSFLTEMLSRFFGLSWLVSGRMTVKFIYPLLIGEEIRCEGNIIDIVADPESPGEGTAFLELFCKNSEDKVISVGTGEVRVKLST